MDCSQIIYEITCKESKEEKEKRVKSSVNVYSFALELENYEPTGSIDLCMVELKIDF